MASAVRDSARMRGGESRLVSGEGEDKDKSSSSSRGGRGGGGEPMVISAGGEPLSSSWMGGTRLVREGFFLNDGGAGGMTKGSVFLAFKVLTDIKWMQLVTSNLDRRGQRCRSVRIVVLVIWDPASRHSSMASNG